jgi:hypothetical protein
MIMKCSKCIEQFREYKSRSELIRDLKAKSESVLHASLKSEVCNMIRQIAKDRKCEEFSVETEVLVKGIGKVDVVAQISDATIAVECGTTNPRKIKALKENFDVVLHIPYCYTREFIDVNIDKIRHQLFVSTVIKGLEKENPDFNFIRNKVFCVEEDECSLPSGRDGYPIEAIQIAGLTVNRVKEKNAENL